MSDIAEKNDADACLEMAPEAVPENSSEPSYYNDGEDPDEEREPGSLPITWREVVVRDGKQWFTDTGEQVGWKNAEYRIITEEDAENALYRLTVLETDIIGEVKKKEALIEALTKPCNKIINDKVKKRDWITRRVSADLHARVVEKIEAGMKNKTVTTHFGSYSCSNIPGRIVQIAPDEAVIEFAEKSEELKHIVVKKTLISLDKREAYKNYTAFPKDWFNKTLVQENAKFEIKLGVKSNIEIAETSKT